MNVIINARHCTPPKSVKDRARVRVRRLSRFEPRVGDAEISFEVDHGEHRVEARLSVAGRPTVIARSGGETFDAALGLTVDRLGRQLRRKRSRRHDRRVRNAAR